MGDVARAARAGVQRAGRRRDRIERQDHDQGAVRRRAGARWARCCRTAGSFNNDVGLPLTILSATGNEAAWVLEMAMRGHGEIAYLAEIARPHIGVITNVGAAHLERLGSLAEHRAREGRAVRGARPRRLGGAARDRSADHGAGRARARRSAPHVRRARGGRRARARGLPGGRAGAVVRYASADVPLVVHLPLAGAHNAANGAAALAVARAAGVAPVAAAARAEEGRRCRRTDRRCWRRAAARSSTTATTRTPPR